jgi:ribosomal protein S10
MFFYLKVSCKDKKILKKFISFFTKIKSLPIFIKPFPKIEKRKFTTVLKSPHVNKTAQEQFEYRYFSKDFLVFSFKPLIFFLLLKKLKNFSFSGIKLEVKGLFEKNKTQKHVLKLISPDNIVLKNVSLNQKSFKKTQKKCEISKPISNDCNFDFSLSKKYIQLFDSYGEMYLQNTFYL